MRNAVLNKVQYVSERLTEGVRSGHYAPGERMPSDRYLAEKYGISYMTARRAVGLLVEAGLVRRQPPQGTFVCGPETSVGNKKQDRRLTLIFTAEPSAATDGFIDLCTQCARGRGLRVQVVRATAENQQEAVDAIRGPGLVLARMHAHYGWRHVEQALVLAANRAVLIGHRMDERGVLSVMGDDGDAMHRSVELLHRAGHRRIAFVMHDPQLMHMRLQIATWRLTLRQYAEAGDDPQGNLILFETSAEYARSESGYTAVLKYLERTHSPATAMICVNDDIAMGAMAACRSSGLRVPEDISFVSLANTEVARFTQPSLTCVAIDLKAEVELAIEMLMRRATGDLEPWDSLHLLAPVVTKRGSVCNRTAGQ